MHAILHDVPLNASPAMVQSYAAVRARMSGAGQEDRDAAVVAVNAALAHPVLEVARQAREIRREWPLLLPLGGRSDSGRLDRPGALRRRALDDRGFQGPTRIRRPA